MDNSSFLTIIDDIADEDEVIRQDIRNAESNPSDPDAWAKLADRLSQKGYYKESLDYYKKALELNANNVSAWYNRGLALSNTGRYDEAVFCFDEAIKINPNYVYAWNSKGYAFNNQGKFREAIKAYDRILEIDPNNVGAWYNRGLALSNTGRYDEAIQSFDEVLKIDANNTDALNAKGLALEGLERYDEAIQSYDEVLKIDAKNIDALNAKGLALERSGKSDDALQYYDKVTQVYAERIKDNSDNGRFLLESGRFRDAIKAYDRVIEIDPNNVGAWYNRGLALSNTGRYDEAIQSFDEVLKMDANNTDALNAKGLALEKMAMYDEAIQSYNRVLEVDPKNTDVLYNKSKQYQILGKHQEAEGKHGQAKESYREAILGLNEIVVIEPTNVRALELLRELYSNYTFEFSKALSLDSRLLAKEHTPVRKAMFAEDWIKNGKNKKGRQFAFESKKEIPLEQIKRQSCVRLLVLSSYFLEGNSIKGNEELAEFLNYYEGLENFRVEEKEWNFNGLIKAINIRSNNPTSNHILINLIDLLRGKGNREKILSNLLSSVSDSGVQLGHKAYTKLKIVVPLALAAVLTTGILAFLIVEMLFAEQCTVPVGRAFGEKIGIPEDMVANDKSDVLYVVDSSQKSILAINCLNTGVVDRIPTGGNVRELSIDKETNTLYADTEDSHETVALAIDGNTFGVDNLFEKFVNKYIKKVIPSAEYKEKDSVSEVILERTPNTPNDNGNNGVNYFVDDNLKAVYAVGDDNTVHSMPSDVISRIAPNSYRSHDIASNPDTNRVYLAVNYINGTGLVYVLDGENKTALKTIKTISGNIKGINSIAVNPVTNKIYLTDPYRQSVSVINGNNYNNAIEKNIPVGRGPGDIFIDDRHNKIYIANVGSNAVSVIDGSKDQVEEIIFFPEGVGTLGSVTVNPETGMLYASFGRNNTSGLINMVNISSVGQHFNHIQVGPTPSYLDYNNVTSKIYVANTQNSSIAVIDATNNTIIKDIDLKGMLPSKLVVNPASNMIYVANGDSDMLSIVDGENDTLLKNETLPFIVSDIAINPNTNKIYAIGDNNDSLSIVDGKRDLITKNEKLSFIPSAISINPVTNKVYIANYNDWSILVLDGSEENVADIANLTIPLNIPPESITIDTKTNRVYVGSYVREDVSKGDEFKPLSAAFPPRTQIQIIDGNNNKVLSNTTLKLDPKYGAVILASNPMNSDTLAVPLAADTILSWNMTQAEEAINRTNGGLINIREVIAGADPAQIAFNVNDGKIYIANYRLNAIMVEDLKKFEAS